MKKLLYILPIVAAIVILAIWFFMPTKNMYTVKFVTDFGTVHYEQQVKEMKEWVDAHPELYPHYISK